VLLSFILPYTIFKCHLSDFAFVSFIFFTHPPWMLITYHIICTVTVSSWICYVFVFITTVCVLTLLLNILIILEIKTHDIHSNFLTSRDLSLWWCSFWMCLQGTQKWAMKRTFSLKVKVQSPYPKSNTHMLVHIHAHTYTHTHTNSLPRWWKHSTLQW